MQYHWGVKLAHQNKQKEKKKRPTSKKMEKEQEYLKSTKLQSMLIDLYCEPLSFFFNATLRQKPLYNTIKSATPQLRKPITYIISMERFSSTALKCFPDKIETVHIIEISQGQSINIRLYHSLLPHTLKQCPFSMNLSYVGNSFFWGNVNTNFQLCIEIMFLLLTWSPTIKLLVNIYERYEVIEDRKRSGKYKSKFMYL